MNRRYLLCLVSNPSRFSIMSVQRRNDEKVHLFRRIPRVLPAFWATLMFMMAATSMGNHKLRDTMRIFRILQEIDNNNSIVNYKMIGVVLIVIRTISSITLAAAGTIITAATTKWSLLWVLLYSTSAVAITLIASLKLKVYSPSLHHSSNSNNPSSETSQGTVDTKLVLISLGRWCNNRRHSRISSRVILRLMSKRISGEMGHRCCRSSNKKHSRGREREDKEMIAALIRIISMNRHRIRLCRRLKMNRKKIMKHSWKNIERDKLQCRVRITINKCKQKLLRIREK